MRVRSASNAPRVIDTRNPTLHALVAALGAVSHTDAVKEIQRNAGTQFSPAVVAAFVAEFPMAEPDEWQESAGEQPYPRHRIASASQASTIA